MTPEEAVIVLSRVTTILKNLQEWSNKNVDYLSNSTPYAAGYKEGIIVAQQIVRSILDDKTE
jgi:hypothetical protein